MDTLKLVFVALCVSTAFVLFCLGLQLTSYKGIVKRFERRFESETPTVPSSLPVRYRPENSTNWGIPFHIDVDVLRDLGLPIKRFVNLNNNTVRQFVFATASSSNHFKESLDAVGSVQQHFPDRQLYYYDLGLNEDQIQQILRMCNVHYRKFDFDKFPGHLRSLKTCAWKPLVIMMLVRDFGGVFYVDASVRLRHNRMKNIYDIAMRSDGFAALTGASGSIFQVTYKERYLYLPVDINKAKESYLFQAGTIVIYLTESVYRTILYWWVLCSLEQFCGAPHLDKQGCACKGKHKHAFCLCDRFDQSTLNVLVNNRYSYDWRQFNYRPENRSSANHIMVVERKVTNAYKIKRCE